MFYHSMHSFACLRGVNSFNFLPQPLKEDKFVIPKSRYDTIDCYLASSEYNDQEVLYDKEVFQLLKDEGLDDLLAQHVAHLFIRDPISLFAEKLEQDVETEADHFEVRRMCGYFIIQRVEQL